MLATKKCNATHTLSGVAGFNFRSIQGGIISVVVGVFVPGVCTEDATDIDDIGRIGFVGGVIVAFFSSFSS